MVRQLQQHATVLRLIAALLPDTLEFTPMRVSALLIGDITEEKIDAITANLQLEPRGGDTVAPAPRIRV